MYTRTRSSTITCDDASAVVCFDVLSGIRASARKLLHTCTHTQAMISSESYSDVTSDVNGFQESESVEDRQDGVGEVPEFLRKADRKTLLVKQESLEDSCNSLLMDLRETSNRIHQTSSRIADYQRQASQYIEDLSGERIGSQFSLPVTTRLARQAENRNCKKPRPLAPLGHLASFVADSASFVADSVARRIQRPRKASANANKEKCSKFGTHSEELADIMSSVEPASASALRMSDVDPEHSTTNEDQSPRLIRPLHYDSEGGWRRKEWKRKMSSIVL